VKQTTAAARIADGYEKQQQAESQTRDRAQAMLDTTVQTVVAELATMLEQAQSVQGRPRRSTRRPPRPAWSPARCCGTPRTPIGRSTS
jgi:hypothetical protein